jgi:hypothetical protein
MAPVLDDIPNELFERIVEQLDACDIFALRLGSRLLASKATVHAKDIQGVPSHKACAT